MLPDILEKLAPDYTNLKLLIAGDGDDVAALKTEFAKRQLARHVQWHGRFSLNDIPNLLSPTTIILDPIDDSIANRAKSSFRVALAGHLGLPVVTSNIGIRYELLPATLHDRFFAAPSDAADYARVVAGIVEHPLNSVDTAQLQHHAQRYTWEALGKQYHAILQRL
jgi:glycosyltransferase involved in cell wall biosynthesis